MALDSMVDQALARCANVEPPPGLEKRILARLERRKARSKKRIHAACVLLAAGICAAAFLQTVDQAYSPPGAGGEPEPTLHQAREGRSVVEIAAEMTSPSAPDKTSAQPPLLSQEGNMPAPKATLIDDLEVEPLKLTDLHLTSLSDSQ